MLILVPEVKPMNKSRQIAHKHRSLIFENCRRNRSRKFFFDNNLWSTEIKELEPKIVGSCKSKFRWDWWKLERLDRRYMMTPNRDCFFSDSVIQKGLRELRESKFTPEWLLKLMNQIYLIAYLSPLTRAKSITGSSELIGSFSWEMREELWFVFETEVTEPTDPINICEPPTGWFVITAVGRSI